MLVWYWVCGKAPWSQAWVGGRRTLNLVVLGELSCVGDPSEPCHRAVNMHASFKFHYV